MRALLDWLDDRTGYRAIVKLSLDENIRGGSRWRYVWGSTLVFTFVVQMITGICLWMAYSPSSQTAWESVYYIQYEMSGGWLLRGIHHYTAQLMIVLLVLHMMQIVIDRSYKAPREFNFWTGLVLALIVLKLSLTGYLLPWDQKGYWATKVATNLVATVPVIGEQLQRLVVGGGDYGHYTLTRFFAFHAGVLPGLLIVLLILHVYLLRRHGLKPTHPMKGPDEPFWPDQFLKDAVACLAVLAAILLLTVWLGAPLSAPADPSEPYAAARPEWYFLSLFQLLKYVPQLWGAIIIPSLIAVAMLAMPWVGNSKIGHRLNVAVLVLLIICAAVLTAVSVTHDRGDPAYQSAVARVDAAAGRVRQLVQAAGGIPPQGAVSLLHNDPLTQGPKLFAAHCAVCHRYDGHNGLGQPVADAPAASDLHDFASRAWLTGLLDPKRIATDHYFGATAFKNGDMVQFVTDDISTYDEDEKQWLHQVVAALSAEAALPLQREMDERDAALIESGRLYIGEDGLACLDCHLFQDRGEREGPDLSGYGSRPWLIGIIHDPNHNSYYGSDNDAMPAFGRDGQLDTKSIGLIADWLRGDWPANGALPLP